MRPITVEYICPNCAASHTVKVWPRVPAIVSGPADGWSDEVPAEIDPEACDYCRKEFDAGAVFELAAEERDNQRHERADAMMKEDM